MLTLISPAKSLDFEHPAPLPTATQPRFAQQSAVLAKILKGYSPQALSDLMGISDKLASLNAARYQQWALPFTPANSKQAVFAFTGDVYTGLDATSLSPEALEFGQAHLGILSGLYGLLRPLDLIQPYRLEMGTSLPNPAGKDLYAYWQQQITQTLSQLLSEQQVPVLVNLASQEYFKVIDQKKITQRIITPVFKDWKNGEYKIISFFAKKARGLMTRFLLQNRLDMPDALKDFNLDGYAFNPALSADDTWVFTRRQQGG